MRDAVIKAIYTHLFDWIVDKVRVFSLRRGCSVNPLPPLTHTPPALSPPSLHHPPSPALPRRMIACQLPGRSDDAVRNRWSRLSDEGPPSRSPPQHAAEGDSPPSLRQTFRSTSSERSFVGGSSKSDRRISWTQAEDAIIVASVHEMGHQWAKVAERIPSRTEHAIRNRLHRLYKLAEDRVLPPE